MDVEAIIEKVLAELSIPNVPFFDNGIDVACFEYISPLFHLQVLNKQNNNDLKQLK